MTAANERYQTLDGEGRVSHNLVYNSTSGQWELEEQAYIDSVTANLYLAVDEIEGQLDDMLANYFLDDYDISSDPIYIGYQTKDGAYYIKRVYTSNGAVDYTKGTSAYSTAWTNRASESFADFGTTF